MISHGTIFVKHLPMEEKIGVHFLLGFTTLQKRGHFNQYCQISGRNQRKIIHSCVALIVRFKLLQTSLSSIFFLVYAKEKGKENKNEKINETTVF